MKLTSSPVKNSSITSRSPERRKRRFRLRSILRDHHALSRRQASAFSTTGNPNRSSAARACSARSHHHVTQPSESRLRKEVLGDKLCCLRVARPRRSGPTIRRPRARYRPRCPRPAAPPVRLPSGRVAVRQPAPAERHPGNLAHIPGFPGAANTSTPADCASFQAKRMLSAPAADHQYFHSAQNPAPHPYNGNNARKV